MNLKSLIFIASFLFFMVSCEKNDGDDPVQEQQPVSSAVTSSEIFNYLSLCIDC